MATDDDSRTTMVGRALLAVVVPASALAIGSLHEGVLVTITTLAALSCALLWLRPPGRATARTRWALIAFALLVATTALQLVPLPAGLVRLIAPENADIWARALHPFGEQSPAWHPISVAPTATRVELARGALYGCVFLAALRVVLTRGGTVFLERVVIGSACLIAIVSLAHPAVHAERVFGIYRPRELYGYAEGRIGPLLNPNHVAAYLNIGACVAAGGFVSERRSLPLPLALGGVVLLAGTSVWAGSRGGTASLVGAAVLLVAITFFYRQRTRTTDRRAEYAIVLLAMLAGGILLGIGASDIARDELVTRDVSKLRVPKLALGLIPGSPALGIGRGAFETVFPSVREGAEYTRFIRVENVVVQWLVEWGVPVALGAFVCLALALRPRGVLSGKQRPSGAWVAIIGAFIHDLVDFHLEVPAVTMLVAVCAAIVVGAHEGDSKRDRSVIALRLRRTRFTALTVSGGAVVAALLVLPTIGHSLPDDRDAVATKAMAPGVSDQQFRDDLRQATLRYPAEPFFPLAGAVHAQRRGKSVVPWVGQALERYPRFGRAHLILARSLVARNRSQARLEYRLAYRDDVNMERPLLTEAPRLVDDSESALELVDPGPSGNVVLDQLARIVAPRLPSTASQLDDELLRRDPNASAPLMRRIEGALSDVTNEHPWCQDRRACLEPAVAASLQLVARKPEACDARLLVARTRIAGGDVGPALDELAIAVDRVSERGACLRALVDLALANGDRRRADDALDRTLRGGCGSRDDCLALYTWAASLEERRGRVTGAISFYKRAADLAPENDAHLLRVAELATSAGLSGEAIAAYQKLSVRHPENQSYAAQVTQLRARAAHRPEQWDAGVPGPFRAP